MGRILSRDAATGIKRVAHVGDREDFLHINTLQDVGGIVEENLRARNRVVEKAARKHIGDGQHKVASVPLSVYYGPVKLSDPNGARVCDLTESEFRAWLNDPDNRAWRTTGTRV